MTIRAIVFDFDGTLADSYLAITASVNHVRARRGLPPLSVTEVKPRVGRGLPQLLHDCVPGTDVEEDARQYREHHPSVLQSGTKLLPDTAITLKELRRNWLKLAVCSNKPVAFTRSLVELFGLADMFDVVLGPEDVPQPKPAPDMLLEAMKRLKVSADETIYVGDMTVDIKTARGAGVTVWVVPTGSDSRETLLAARPDRVLDSLAEIPGLFESS